jgi:hypothetical protein
MVATACAAKTRSRETQATDEQWLDSTLSLEIQVCERKKKLRICASSLLLL